MTCQVKSLESEWEMKAIKSCLAKTIMLIIKNLEKEKLQDSQEVVAALEEEVFS
jgi:hypothetical protein